MCTSTINKPLNLKPKKTLNLGKRKLVQMIGRFEKSVIKSQCLTGEGKLGFVQIIRNFEKRRV